MEAKVDQDVCIGCGLCADVCPEVFRMEEDKAIVHAATVPKAAEDSCEQAADECPVTAIAVEK